MRTSTKISVHSENELLVKGFIYDIWNSGKLNLIDKYLHPNFIDHLLPKGFQNQDGLFAYLGELQRNITHRTTIDKITQDDDFIIISFTLTLGCSPNPTDEKFRNISQETIKGRRIFVVSDGLIISHWEII